MNIVDVHDHAVDDIRTLRAINIRAAAAVLVVLEQIGADPRAIDKLTTHGENLFGTTRLNVKRWQAAKGIGNLWRFRILDTPATTWRIVYGYHWQTRRICVLAVVEKEEFDYDDLASTLSQRIAEDWRTL